MNDAVPAWHPRHPRHQAYQRPHRRGGLHLPEGEVRLRDMLASWERFLHNQTDLEPLIRMAVDHCQFEAMHPFTDGNGRTGRVPSRIALPA